MTVGDTAVSIASFGVLAQIGSGTEWGSIEGIAKLGVQGVLVYGLFMLWKRMEKQDRDMRAAEEQRHKEEHEMNERLLNVLLKLDGKFDKNGGNENKREKE